MDPADQVLDALNGLVKPVGRPLVTLSYAQSIDGSIAARRGFPLAISSSESARLTHQLRAAHDAILVGIGTVLSDDPRLSVRLVEGNSPQPVVLDSRLRFPLVANLMHGRRPWIATTDGADLGKAAVLQERGASVMVLPAGGDGRVSLPALLEQLEANGIERVMVEGGASVITSFLACRLVDFLALTLAPLLVGGVRAVERLLVKTNGALPGHFPRLAEMSVEKLGADLAVFGIPVWP